jgi:ribosomal protein L3 glutamine methyltransferase
MKVLQLVQQAAVRLQAAGVHFGHGTTNAHDEAAWLVLWRLGLPLDGLDEVAEREVMPDEESSVDALVDERIRSRRPAAYLTGEAWLQGVPFHVDERVIVPRSLIAEPLAEGSFDAWLGPQTLRVLDLCTGNGSLAVLAAMAWPEVAVDATDLSTDALAVAAKNVARHGLQARISLHQGDGLAAVAGRRYDLVLCNPPYVNGASMAVLPAEYLAEPVLSLAGGADGMDFIRGMLATLPAQLNDGGVLVLEVGHELAHFEAAFPGLPFVGLSTSAGDEQVLLITATDLKNCLPMQTTNENP